MESIRTIEKIDELDYELTWDEQVLYQNAEEVNVREGQLILQYNTQDSEYQMADEGGQTWAFDNAREYTYLISGTKLPELDNSPKTLSEYLKQWYNTNSYKDEEISLIDFRNIDGYAQDRKI